MKDIKPIDVDELRKMHPEALDTLFNPKDVGYCNVCDGLRNRDHECVDCLTKLPLVECPCDFCVDVREGRNDQWMS